MKPTLFVGIAATVIFLSSINFAQAQLETYRAEDGTEIQLEILSVNPHDAPKLHIAVGGFGLESIKFLNASYYEPEKFMINSYVGASSFMVDGNYFFSSKLKDKKQRQSVKSMGDTKYAVKYDIKKQISWGVHGGFSQADYSDAERMFSTAPIEATGIILGATLLGSKYSSLSIKDSYKARKGHSLSRLNADVVFFVNRSFVSDYEPSEYNAPPTVDDVSRPVGLRLYYDGFTSIWGRSGRLTVHYMLGVSINAQEEIELPVVAGIGVGYSFL